MSTAPLVDPRDRMFTIAATLEQVLNLAREELAEAEEGSEYGHLLKHLKKSLENALFYVTWATHEKENQDVDH